MPEPSEFGSRGAGAVILNRSPNNMPTPKLVWATLGNVVGDAVAILLLGYGRREGWGLSPVEEGAVQAIISALFAFALGYATPPAGWQGDYGKAVVFLAIALGMTACTTPSGRLDLPLFSDPRAAWFKDCDDYGTSLRALADKRGKLSAFEVRLVDSQREVIGPLCPPRRTTPPTSPMELSSLSHSVAVLKDLEKEANRR